ncbi:hypothetical protein [Vibrio diazotrophicus]|uniref:hypothetical protein n=1 Tax=Vibrio diazotrophicus TaxID=685 RepID=UPI000C9EA50C|nr:hypothetical protein [Vibrio diazotrophicus]PNH90521.1 hypothetical protein C1M59_16410 [Vibrio diazotrophicus]
MNEINRYICNQQSHINSLKQLPLTNFFNQNDEPATWDDPVIRYVDPNGKRINFYLVNNTVNQCHIKAKYSQSQLLSLELRHLLIAYAIELCASKGSVATKANKHAIARELLCYLDDNPARVTSEQVSTAFAKLKSVQNLPVFFHWLHDKDFISLTLKLPQSHRSQQSLDADDIIEVKKKLIPESKVLLALGAVFHDVIPHNKETWNTHALAPQRDSYVCSMVALGMSSPNRMAAEQTVLETQILKSHTRLNNNVEETIHYLDWHGSKGFKNYQNHILSVMAEAVDRSLNFIGEVTKSGRSLVRFYEQPSLPLKEVLGDFSPSKENFDSLSPDMDKPINLIHLGFLLGFYDGTDFKLRVSKETKGAERYWQTKGSNKYIKSIVDLRWDDVLMIEPHCKYSNKLLGIVVGNKTKEIFGGGSFTVSEFQNRWISYIHKKIPEFPMAVNNATNGKCKYKHALFCFNGYQIFLSGSYSAYPHAKSFYGIVPIKTLSNILAPELSITDKSPSSMLRRHGFSNEFSIQPHQLRHWQNDVADREGIPHSIINLWSGRKTPEQILHYIHRTHDEKSSEISDILFSKDGKDISVKVVGQDEYEKLTDIAATETSTGFCSQSLTISPCNYLNDFVTQCTLCPSSCHISHDEGSITLLKKDLQVQERRLEDVQNREAFCSSKAMQNWFLIHHKNTSLLKELISLMQRQDIKAGCVIRLLADKGEYRITDIQAKTVTIEKLTLPDPDGELVKVLKSKQNNSSNDDFLDDILSLI